MYEIYHQFKEVVLIGFLIGSGKENYKEILE